jgi:ABC-type lipoprotein release transport system permease subunit
VISLALKSLRQRLGLSLVCIFACAIAVASLGASLGVGDALESELARLARARRGQATDVLLFSRSLSAAVLTSVAEVPGRAAAVYDERGRTRVPEGPHIESTVLGIDDSYTALHGLPFPAPKGREAYLSAALAEVLGVKVGETVLVDIPKARALSASLLFGDRTGAQATLRLRVAKILGPSEGGEFTLRPTPDLPRAVYASVVVLASAISNDESEERSELPSIANRLLIRAQDASDRESWPKRVVDALTLEDYGLRISTTALGTVVHAGEATITPDLEAGVRKALAVPPHEALAYLATGIDVGKTSVPYSVVMGLTLEDLQARSGSSATAVSTGGRGLWLSEWAARDLSAKPGSLITLHFDVWREAGRLEPQSVEFTLAGIVPDARAAQDRALVPTYPGISDAKSLGEWNPPFPIELARIRPKDEDFWKEYGPSPKAYLDIATARELFGESGSRLTTLFTKSADEATLSRDVLLRLREGKPPFIVQDLASASGASSALDFGAYFAGFSALLIMSALLVAAAFVRFLFETRSRELGVLRMCGWNASDVRRLCITEASLLSGLGALVGLVLTPLVSLGLQQILKPVWARGVSEPPALVTAESLVASTVLGFLLSVAALVLALRATLRREPLDLLLSREGEATGKSRRRTGWLPAVAATVFILAVALIQTGRLPEGPGFFLVGGCVLAFGLGLMRRWILGTRGGSPSSPIRVGLRGLRFRPARVLFVATLLSSATFVVFAVSSFAKRDTSDRTPSGPRGGFDLFVETSGPVFDDIGTPEGRLRSGVGDAEGPLGRTPISRFRLREGEDTSCLNLYAPSNPRLLGVEKAFRDLGRFPFAASLATTEAEKANPWTLLMPAGGLGQEIPAIVDANSLQYVLHKSLGDTMDILDGHGKPLRLKFVASLKETALRSEILIAEEAFETYFPEAEGYRVFLVEAPSGETDIAQALRDAWRDRGALVSSLADRLARYYEVENTYLASFQWLGALAAALSTLTLIAVAARSVFERRAEWFVLRTSGFAPRDLRVIVASEIAALALASVSIGAVAAAIALLPLPRASQPALVLALLFPAICLLATAAATLGAFKVLENPRVNRPAIG